jgi:hypothetical protein
MADEFDAVWHRIVAYAGETFQQKRGNPFTYEVVDNAVIPDRTNRVLPRSQFEQAWGRMPAAGPGDLQDLQGPSYLWAVLTYERIAG